MYDFKLLDAYYDVDITLEYPDYRHTYYHCREHLIARYNKEKDVYSIQLEERRNISLNDGVPQEIMDILMVELGNSLYPISLDVSPRGEVLQVSNFDIVSKRWNERTKNLLEQYNTFPFSRYIQISSRNMKDEVAFREALARNTFVKLILKPLEVKNFTFPIENFPNKGMKAIFNCTKKQFYTESDTALIYEAKLLLPSDCQGDGYVKYEYSELYDVLEVEARFDIVDAEGQKSVKKIIIKTDKHERSISAKKTFWNSIF